MHLLVRFCKGDRHVNVQYLRAEDPTKHGGKPSLLLPLFPHCTPICRLLFLSRHVIGTVRGFQHRQQFGRSKRISNPKSCLASAPHCHCEKSIHNLVSHAPLFSSSRGKGREVNIIQVDFPLPYQGRKSSRSKQTLSMMA